MVKEKNLESRSWTSKNGQAFLSFSVSFSVSERNTISRVLLPSKWAGVKRLHPCNSVRLYGYCTENYAV